MYVADQFFDFGYPEYVDDMVRNPKYYADLGVKCSVEHMAPETFLTECAKLQDINEVRELCRIKKDLVVEIAQGMLKGKKFALPVIDYNRKEITGKEKVRAIFYLVQRDYIKSTRCPVAVIRKI